MARAVEGGVRPLQHIKSVPCIDVAATRSSDGNKLAILAINRSLQSDIPIEIHLPGSSVGPAQMKQLKAESQYERNDEVEPSHIAPVLSTLPVSLAVTVTLPHESVTEIRVPASGSWHHHGVEATVLLTRQKKALWRNMGLEDERPSQLFRFGALVKPNGNAGTDAVGMQSSEGKVGPALILKVN